MDEPTLHQLLKKALEYRASDVHFKVGQPPAFRVDGDLRYLQGDKLRAEQTQRISEIIVARARYKGAIEDLLEFDCSYSAPGCGRYRVNVYKQRGTLAVAMRLIPLDIPTYEMLGAPSICSTFAQAERGMVLVVGAAGNGKSSTLAAIIGEVNRTRRVHVVTIEDPIEFMHTDQLATISQREVGLDTGNFANALRGSLRQDPDVILVGEIRDAETMDIALKAAETGHLVFSTLHTPDVQRTVGRILALAGDQPPEEVRERFADNLRGIIAQRLLPNAAGRGLVLAAEVLYATGTVKDAIKRPSHNPPLKDLMEKGVHPYNMQTFEMAMRDLVKAGKLTVEVARQALA
ncbi:MAG: PilT/PilU family type 4a pilus ATPase [Deltaproteobacteria bacterium]|nr:PilT/PilU family type 4a pilus ATPase [Deltaproteobacteria bacterium]